MRRILLSLVATSLVAGLFGAPGAAAQGAEPPAPPEVPAEPNVTDPAEDANYLNDQGLGTLIGHQGENGTPADPSTVADILAGWFTADAENITFNIQTQAPAPATPPLAYRAYVDPADGTGCLEFEIRTAGTPVPAESTAWVDDNCGEELVTTDAVLTIFELEDGTGILSVTAPRSASPSFADGTVLTPVDVTSRNVVPGAVTAPQIDNTTPGTPYTVASPEKPKPKPKPCGKKKASSATAGDDAKPKGKKCPKPKPKPKPKKCTPYAPGEQGAEAETTVVTDAATAEKPIEMTFPIDAGVGIGGLPLGIPGDAMMSHVFHNLQVDSKAKEAGLWVRLEFSEGRDLDLHVNNPDGTTAVAADGFNPEAVVEPIEDEGSTSETGAEQVNGLKSADCQGYTLDLRGATTEGEDVTLKLWLGEALYDPTAA